MAFLEQKGFVLSWKEATSRCTPMTTAAMRTTAGTRIRFSLKVTVISFEAAGFVGGMILAAVGIPLSIFSNSSCSSLASAYLACLSFSRHFSTRRLKSGGIWALNSFGSLGISLLIFTPTVKGVSPSNGTRPVSHLVENDAQGIDVRRADRVSLPSTCSGLMYSGVPMIVAGARDPVPLERTGDAEIHDPAPSPVVDHDVLRLEVPVNDPQSVRFLQAVGRPACRGSWPSLMPSWPLIRIMLFRSSPDTYSIVM